MTKAVYWKLRCRDQSVRQYFSIYYTGEQTGQTWETLWQSAEIVDSAWKKLGHWEGAPRIDQELDTSDSLEHLMCYTGAQSKYIRTGYKDVYKALLSCRPPGHDDILPDQAMLAARDRAQVKYKQNRRLGSRYAGTSSEEELGRPPRHVGGKSPARNKRQDGKESKGRWQGRTLARIC